MILISQLLQNFIGPPFKKEMPADVVKVILSYLPYSSLQHAASVSTQWKKLTIETTVLEQRNRIQHLAMNLGIAGTSWLPDCDSLPKIKSLSLNYLDQFVDHLKKLSVEDLAHLEKCPLPKFFEYLFGLAKIYQKKEQDYAKQDPKFKHHFLAVELLKQGYTAESFKVASIENPSYNFFVLANQLAEMGRMQEAYEAIARIPDETNREYARKQVDIRHFPLKSFLTLTFWTIIPKRCYR